MKKVFFVLMVAVSAGIFFVSCSNANAVESKDNKSDLAAETVDNKADADKDNIRDITAETVDNNPVRTTKKRPRPLSTPATAILW